MLVRLLIVCVAILLASLLLRLHRRFRSAPPWLRLLHKAIFVGSLGYVLVFAALFIALHVFGYQL